MGRLVDQFCDACEEGASRSPSGHSILLFILALVGGSPTVPPLIRTDPSFATVAHARILLERLVHGSKMTESFLVLGLIQAIEDVLVDCLESVPAHGEINQWSFATQRLIQRGLLVDAEGFSLLGDIGTLSPDQQRQVRTDLEMWWELTAPIRAGQNLELAIREEAEEADE